MGPPGPPCTLCYPNPNYLQVDKKMGLSGSPEYLVPTSDVTYKNLVFDDQKAGGFYLRGPTGPVSLVIKIIEIMAFSMDFCMLNSNSLLVKSAYYLYFRSYFDF